MDACRCNVIDHSWLANKFLQGKEDSLYGRRAWRSSTSVDYSSHTWRCLGLNSRNSKYKSRVAILSILKSDLGKDLFMLQAPIFKNPKADPQNVASIVLGGGAGSQLFPLTSKRAKHSVPIGGCYRLIDIPMSNLINSGIKKIFVLTQFNSFSLNRHLARTYNFGDDLNFGGGFLEILAATQTPGEDGNKWFQGSADAVRQFSWIFEDFRNKNVENVVILAGDHLYRMNYMDLVQKHIDTNADITISCVPMDGRRASNYGLLKVDNTGRIIQFAEKPKGSNLKAMQVDASILSLYGQDVRINTYIASMGVYVFRTDVLLNLLKWSYPFCNDFGSDIIPFAMIDHNIQAYIFNDYWEDIGSVKSFFEANLGLTEQSPKFQFYDPKTPIYTSPRYLPPSKVDRCKISDSIVSHGCFLGESRIKHSIVGVRSRLENGVELEDTMMMGADNYQAESEIASLLAMGKVPIGVGQNTKIRNCIIDKNAKIGKDVIIANKDGVVEANKPKEGFYIRSGITIIMKNATIEDKTII